jgi:hypothetical protein
MLSDNKEGSIALQMVTRTATYESRRVFQATLLLSNYKKDTKTTPPSLNPRTLPHTNCDRNASRNKSGQVDHAGGNIVVFGPPDFTGRQRHERL